MLTAARLREVLHYDPLTGHFTWLKHFHERYVGQRAGSLKSSGYVEIKVDRRLHRAHRLAWLYVHGQWPAGELDHRNTVCSDNRLQNLRPATRGQQCQNTKRRKDNQSGVKGVAQTRTGKFIAYVNNDGKRRHLGTFDDLVSATTARQTAAASLHKEFAR